MAGDAGRVTACHRSGQRRLPALQGVLQRRPGEWTDHPFSKAARLVTDEFLAEQFLTRQRGPQRLQSIGEQRDDMVTGMCERGVV